MTVTSVSTACRAVIWRATAPTRVCPDWTVAESPCTDMPAHEASSSRRHSHSRRPFPTTSRSCSSRMRW
jgi:hypothetical protein